jgi:hypothetical protein
MKCNVILKRKKDTRVRDSVLINIQNQTSCIIVLIYIEDSILDWHALAIKLVKQLGVLGEVLMCRYLPHINRLFVVFTHCTRSCSRNTTDS